MNMISRKVEERNEKIVRGLLKLPPNRRCINCDSLGPQYVCTNFWTFICTTCSGIHREFTHRVKSISMSKFTTQEVEALQNGGNQRARELYLKGWDFQRQRLPSSSNVEKIREFIKNAYVDKKYVSGKISDAPTDPQAPKTHDEHRRASSYHSYSQSPPYDHQYEERKYGKRAPVLTRKPGSERSLHIEKLSSFVYSPTRMSEKANTNEGSISRYSLHSESSGGDHFRSELMSPSSYSNHGFSSPSAQDSMEWKTSTFMEEDARRDVNKVPRPQRTLSSGSFGLYDRNSESSYSYNSNNQVHNAPEHDRSVVGHHNEMLAIPSMEKHSSSERSGNMDFFTDQVVSQSSASSTVDFIQLPSTSSSTFTISQASAFDTPMAANPFQSSITPPPVDFFGSNSQDLLHVTNTVQASSEMTVAKNEGWATFDMVPVESSSRVPLTNEPHKSDNGSEGNSFSVSPFGEKTHFEPLQCENHIQVHNSAAGSDPPVPSHWSNIMQPQAVSGATISQSWNAFEDPTGHTQWESIPQNVEPHFSMGMPSADGFQFMNSIVTEGLKGDATNGSISEYGLPFSSLYQHTSSELHPDQQPYTIKYTNPFDLPFDSDSETNNEFLHMNSLGAALPKDPVPTAFPNEFADPWPSQYPVAATLPITAEQASIPYMAGQSQSSHLKDVAPHNPLASIGGNPFA